MSTVTTLFYGINHGPSFNWNGITFTNSVDNEYTASPTSLATTVPFALSLRSVTIGNIVTIVGNNSFQDCRNLTSVTFEPTSIVEELGYYSFIGCNSLVSFVIPSSVKILGSEALNGCGFTTITIPTSVTNDLFGTFKDCANLSSVIFDAPCNIPTFNYNTFHNCSSLSSITIPASVTVIGYNVFRSCINLTSIVIPTTVTSILGSTFHSCIGLQSVSFDTLSNVLEIGFETFRGCSSLPSITFPASVTSISNDNVFYGCSSLTSIGVDVGNLNYLSSNGVLFNADQTILQIFPPGKGRPYTIPSSVTNIDNNSFQQSTNLLSITIPTSVSIIGSSAFKECTNLELVTFDLPSQIETINFYTFNTCTSLTSITLPPLVTNIQEGSFYNCTSLTSITLPPSVTYLADGIFAFCNGLTEIEIPNSVTFIGSSAFNECTSLGLFTFDLPSQIVTINYNTFNNCTSLASITLPASVTSIDGDAFANCTSLASITLPPLLTNLAYGIFNNCIGLTEIEIPNSVTFIDPSAFANSGLTTVSLSDTEAQTLGLLLEPQASWNSPTPNPPGISNFFGVTENVEFILPPQPPSIDTIVPSSGSKAGDTSVTITGVNFTGTTSVTFGGTEVTDLNIVNDTEISCRTPASDSVGVTGVVVTNNIGSSSPGTFTYTNLPPSIDSILPSSGSRSGGTSVTITGVNFTGTTSVTFGGTLATDIVVTDTEITCTTPAHIPGTVNVIVANDGGSSALPDSFTYINLLPIITTISPSVGGKNGGTPVTITGINLTGTTSVTFDGNTATNITVVNDTQITCRTPAHDPGSVDVIVTNDIGRSNSITFTYDITCFKEGSQIFTDKGYILVQNLRKGDLVKTVSSGFKKVEHIGYSKMYHNVNNIRSEDKLYRCSTNEYPELIEDLIITGGHSILLADDFKQQTQRDKTIEVLGQIYVTEDHYRLPACVDDRTKIFEEEGIHTIWHFSLENNDYYTNYGVYANGLLVETASNRMMVEKSGLTLLE